MSSPRGAILTFILSMSISCLSCFVLHLCMMTGINTSFNITNSTGSTKSPLFSKKTQTSFRDAMVDDPTKEAAAHGTFDAGACVVDAASGRKTKNSSAQTVDRAAATGGKKRATHCWAVLSSIYRGAHTQCEVHVQPCAIMYTGSKVLRKPVRCVPFCYELCNIAPSLKLAHRIAKRPP